MEPLLNFLWCAVSLAIAIFVVRQRVLLAKQREWGLVAVVFVLLALILFSPISMTDDLHQAELLLYGDSDWRVHSVIVASPLATIPTPQALVAALFLMAALLALARFVFRPGQETLLTPQQGLSISPVLRAPPLPVLP